jgi:integrase/recombinase XerC
LWGGLGEESLGTLHPYAVEYVMGRKRRGEIATSTVVQHRSVLHRLADVHGDRPVDRFGSATIRRWQESVAHLKPSTRASAWTAIVGFTRWMQAEGVIAKDPCVGVKAPRRPRGEPRALESGSVARLLEVAPDARARAIIWLEVGLGLRRIEVHRLQVEDWLRRDQLMRVTGKGSHERTVPVVSGAARALDDYLAEWPATVGPMIRSTTNPSNPLSLSALSHYMAEWMYAAGIKNAPRDGVNGHALRHTAASDVLDECGDLRVVQEMLGHRSLATSSIYLRRADIRRMRDAMENRDYGAAS